MRRKTMGNKGIGLIEVLLIAVDVAVIVTSIISGRYLWAALGLAALAVFFIIATM